MLKHDVQEIPGRLRVSQRPARSPSVRLLGEMPETGFEESQWLVERDGRFLQLTELLYRVLEQTNGERSLEEIARAVTDSTEWLASDEDVQQLIRRKLIPLGLVTVPGEQAEHRNGTRHADSPSPLAVNLKLKTLGPRVIDPLTSLLQYLYWPPVLAPLLAGAVAAHVWLYAVHGLTGAVVDALFTPSFLLVLLALTLLSGIVHEFGHASALRYGGGRPRRIGFGFYLVFPAFFTDVTDSYRLGRWGRVRTGLGGVYFHLLFAVALIGASIALGQEFLLLAVVLINVEIVRQFIPFVRLDGYWVLADLTGIPDFLSQTGPFLRSLLPAGRIQGTRLPRLKRWVRAAFLTYLLVTIPLLAVLLFAMVRYLPRVATIVWDAAATQLALFAAGRRDGDVLGMATAAAELTVLVLPALGMAYLVYTLTWRPLRAVWRQPTAPRRLAGGILVAAALSAIGLWWAPKLPFARSVAPAGVRTFAVADRTHVRGSVEYAQTPPVGGPHASVWQNCGFYERPIRNENAVHSLEHGAVWIAYRPSLAAEERQILRRIADEQTYVLVSPYPGLTRPVVASAWGRQLALASVHDARLDRFLRAYRLDARAPEAGGPCTGGKGDPRSE